MQTDAIRYDVRHSVYLDGALAWRGISEPKSVANIPGELRGNGVIAPFKFAALNVVGTYVSPELGYFLTRMQTTTMLSFLPITAYKI